MICCERCLDAEAEYLVDNKETHVINGKPYQHTARVCLDCATAARALGFFVQPIYRIGPTGKLFQ